MSQQAQQTLSGVKIWIDKDFLQTTKGAGEMLTLLQANNVNCIIDKLPVRNSLFWTRCEGKSNEDEVQHDQILVRVDWDFLIDSAADFLANRSASQLGQFIDSIKTNSQCTQITFLIFEFKRNWKNFKNSSDKSSSSQQKSSSSQRGGSSKTTKISKSDLSEVQITLELEERVQIRSYEEASDLKELVLCYTKSISEYASKHSSKEQALFSDSSIEKAQTKIGKDGQGLINLWKEMIQTFPMVSSDQAQAICALYPSPLLLKQAYDKLDHSTGAMLLADIQVRRGAGVLSNVRRIGPELSQKLYKFFNSIKPDELLVNN